MVTADQLFRDDRRNVLTVSLHNEQPVDLIHLTTSLQAIARDFSDFSADAVGHPPQGELRLYVREMRSGSIIADLIPLATQLDWLLDHKEVLGGFVTHLADVAGFFLGTTRTVPTPRQAARISQIVEPVAKDAGSQFNIQASDHAKVEVHNHLHIGFVEANAIQNGARNFLGPHLPGSKIYSDRLLVLEQVKNDARSITGDRGIIESIWSRPVRLRFDDAKQSILSLTENPFQKAFLVDVEVQSIGGKPVLYRIIKVKEVIDLSE